MDKACKASGKVFTIDVGDMRMLEKLSPRLFGVDYPLPLPTLSPEERKRRRLASRNERRLYRRKCDLTGAAILSSYSPDKPFKVYERDAWWSDRWSPLAYGRPFDFNRTFFEQLMELQREVPRMSLVTTPDAEKYNCTYVNFAGGNRNCYLIFDSDMNEDSYYSNVLKHSRNCMDCSYAEQCDHCYQCIDCTGCYEMRFTQDCVNCANGMFLDNCIGCNDCFFCCNLKNKRYWIRNEQRSKEDYERIMASPELRTHSGLKRLRIEFDSFTRSFPKKYTHRIQAENCIGDYLNGAKNCWHCFNIGDGEDLRYCDALYGAKDCMDVSSFGEHIEHIYESGTIGINDCYLWFCFASVQNCANLLYCLECRQCQNCFGCISLKRNSYCVLNKQYTKAEYQALLPKLVRHLQNTGEWGEYFPLNMSAYGYNETIAQERFPLDREAALAMGALWSDYEPPAPQTKTLDPGMLPEKAEDITEELLGAAVRCEATGKPFRFVEPELRFYRSLSLPLPRRHPDARHLERISRRNPEQLWRRHCAKTGVEVLSSYNPGRPETILSEEAFREELL